MGVKRHVARLNGRNSTPITVEAPSVAASKPGLFETLGLELRRRHYSPSTERAYDGWVRRFVAHHGRRHPRELGAEEIRAFLDSLVASGVSVSTHQQALCALTFLYREVLGMTPPWVTELKRPQRKASLPLVLTRDEVKAILRRMEGVPELMATLIYGTGLGSWSAPAYA